MNDENPRGNLREWEWVLAQLVRRDSGEREVLEEPEESTIRGIEMQLDTLVEQLRQPPPVDDFADESGCQRAIEMVERIPEREEFSRSACELQWIGPYQVLAKLRQGGMGTVYRAVHTKLQRVVAIKILPRFRTPDAGAVTRFEREMLALGGLSHRNIVAATDAGEVDGMHYLVMEYVDGLDLSTLVRRVGPLAVADACEIVRQAAEGVAEAHRRGIVHRDIKPSNLILVEGGTEPAGATVKVLDFGLARLASEFADEEVTTSGQIMGTLKYMAPEQCSNSRDVDVRADVYSLGATLYRMLTGKAPFSGARYESPPALVAALANESPMPITSLRGELPPQLVGIVERMMAKDPAKRYATPIEVIDALAPWTQGADLAGLLARARAADNTPPTVPFVRESSIQEPRPAVQVQKPVDSRLVAWRSLLLGAVLLLGGAAVVVFAWLNTAPHDSPPSDPAREVVKWLLAQKSAEAGVSVKGRGFVKLSSEDAVPSEPFRLLTADVAGDTSVRGEDFARFDQLPDLASLSLTGPTIGDDMLRHLGSLPALKYMFLAETSVTDDGVAELKRFPQLVIVHLYETKVTDTGLKHLVADNMRLGELSLVGCDVTDAGIPSLTKLKQLKLLALDRTNVTAAGVARLQIALPDCEIRSDFTEEEIAAEMERQRADSSRTHE